jgi:hypothetical protein
MKELIDVSVAPAGRLIILTDGAGKPPSPRPYSGIVASKHALPQLRSRKAARARAEGA